MMSINYEKINELKELDDDGSDDTLKQLIGLYLDSTPPKLQKISESISSKNFSAARTEAHSLRSSSLTLGAEVLSQCAFDIEYSKEGPNLETQASEIIKKAMTEFETVKSLLSKYL